jgi:hypothetical protein
MERGALNYHPGGIPFNPPAGFKPARGRPPLLRRFFSHFGLLCYNPPGNSSALRKNMMTTRKLARLKGTR